MGSRTSTDLRLTLLVSVAGFICVLVLPGFPVGRAATAPRVAGQGVSRSGLDRSRHAAMLKLYAKFKAGDQFSEEEGNILRKFGEGYAVSDLEADLVISRALNDYYVVGNELTKEQEDLLGRYTQSVARRDHDIADRKTQLLNRHNAAAANASPRNTPLAPPTNDLCSGAEVIPGAGPFPYLTAVTSDITDATATGDPPLPSCQTNVSRSIWYTFTPATNGDYTISSCADGPTATTVDDTGRMRGINHRIADWGHDHWLRRRLLCDRIVSGGDPHKPERRHTVFLCDLAGGRRPSDCRKHCGSTSSNPDSSSGQ